MNEQRDSAWPRRDIEMALFDADYGDTDYGDLADAVIAHLWREAMKPKVVEAVFFDGHVHAEGGGVIHVNTPAMIRSVLTALLGPNPHEEVNQ